MNKINDKILSVDEASGAILGNSLDNLKELVIEYANSGNNILFAGAPGVGKELFANLYAAATKRIIEPVNMTGIPSELIDSSLFGSVKGSHSTADQDKSGLISKAKGKTHCFFLDELGDIPADAQAKLLRFIQSGEFRKVGSNIIKEISREDLRVVAASNKPECIRDDLKDRFKCLRIPSLVERYRDIPLLMKYFIKKTKDHNVTGITEYTLNGVSDIVLDDYEKWSHIHPWKGNVRELEKVLENAIFLCKKRGDKILTSEDFPTFFWKHKVLESWEKEIKELEREPEDPWDIPPRLLTYKKRYGSSAPYPDSSETIKINDLPNSSTPLPYHHFIKSLPGEVSKEDQVKEEIRYLRGGVDGINKTLSSINDKIPAPEPTQKNQITYDNTIPAKFENDFYDHHAKKDTPHVKIVEAYKKQRFSIDRKTVSERMQKALERTNPI